MPMTTEEQAAAQAWYQLGLQHGERLGILGFAKVIAEDLAKSRAHLDSSMTMRVMRQFMAATITKMEAAIATDRGPA